LWRDCTSSYCWGLLIALVGLVGGTLEWASSPNLNDVQETVRQNLEQMPWYDQMYREGGDEAVAMFRQIYDMNWRIVKALAPSPAGSLLGLVTKPLGLILNWLIFGVIAYLLARLLGGTGNLSQTLGATALAAAPQLLNVLAALPFVAAAGVGAWVMLCRYMALRTVHELSWQRAVVATILPPILIGLFAGALITLFGVLFGASLAAMFAGG